MRWALTTGQTMAEPLTYAKLPAQVIAEEGKALAKIK
jgi:hypothetical protein